jgi:ParB family transcriptional regulator, chromosome partitioning protein
VTKDRRLGRGLAALLGTPVDEATGIEADGGSNPMIAGTTYASTNARPASSLPPATSPTTGRPAAQQTPDTQLSRTDTIRQLANDARANQSRGNISPITFPVAPVASTNSVESNSGKSAQTLDLPVDIIDANPFQPRRQFNASEIESLAESLKEHQQLQPILVRRVGERYQLISGERRLRATIFAGLPTIRAEVRVADDRLVAELAIIENLQRKDLNAIEKALSFKRYITEHKCTQDELAQRLKIDRSTIANMMRLLELPEIVTDAVQRDEITAGHAKALLSLGSIKEQVAALKKIQEEGWSVRETEAQVAETLAKAAADEDGILGALPRRKASKSDQLASLERDLKMSLGTRVDISQTSRGRGKITIHFTSVEEFDRLRHLLANDLKRKAA